MKDLNTYIIENQYINEGIVSWFKAFFQKVFKNTQSLIKNGKTQQIQMDTDKLVFSKNPIELNSIDNLTLKSWEDTNIGYNDGAQIYKLRNKLPIDVDTSELESEPKPMVIEFYYKGNSMYNAALLIYDDTYTLLDGYKHIYTVNPNLCVKNHKDVEEAVLKRFKEYLDEHNKGVEGFTINKKQAHRNGEVINNCKFEQIEENPDNYKLEM